MKLAAVLLAGLLVAANKPRPSTCVQGVCLEGLNAGSKGYVEGVLSNTTGAAMKNVDLTFMVYTRHLLSTSADSVAEIPKDQTWRFRVPVTYLGEDEVLTRIQASKIRYMGAGRQTEVYLSAVPSICFEKRRCR